MEGSDPQSDVILESLRVISKVLATREDKQRVPAILAECIECLAVGSTLVEETGLAIRMA